MDLHKKARVKKIKKQEEHEKSEIKRGLIFTYGPAKGLSLNEPQLPGTAYEHHAFKQSTNYFTKCFPGRKCAGKVRVLMLSRNISQIRQFL
jgi:hypothetical protein